MSKPDVIKYDHRHDKNKILDWYKKFLEKNSCIYLLAGELNPQFYDRLVSELAPLIKDKRINIIGGPFIAVEDTLFREYHALHDNFMGYWWNAKRKGNWWQVHPLFNLAKQNKNVELYVTKKGVNRTSLSASTLMMCLLKIPIGSLKKRR